MAQIKETPSPDMNREDRVIIDKSHKYTTVFANNYIGPGNAHHHYIIDEKAYGNEPHELLRINFQNGPIKESGINGVMDENLLAIVIDRLEGFESGKYASPFNARALIHIKNGLQELQNRTAEREARGVEGTHKI